MKKYICFQFAVCMACVAASLLIAYTDRPAGAKKILKHVITDSSRIHESEENIAKIVSGIVVGD